VVSAIEIKRKQKRRTLIYLNETISKIYSCNKIQLKKGMLYKGKLEMPSVKITVKV
jgi:hypothetical protein